MDRFEEVKERVKEAHDLVEVVQSYVPLKATGRNLVALCPFHDEKTPSFTVYPDSQHFKCYGCGISGDVFSFLMEREGLQFRECLEMLAERSGISLEGVFGGGGGRKKRGPDPYAVLAQVRDFFHAMIQHENAQFARDYLEERGLSEGIEPFKIGVHPTSPGALKQFAQAQKLPMNVLQEAGLIGRGGGEPFRGRVMFPIEDERGRVVGFGGRTLQKGQPKYINSPESPIFRKRSVLYGLRMAKQAGERRIVVMEGYTDVIACHLAGFEGAVATLGTALTKEHGKVLVRYARDGVVLLFDGDRAGRAAAEKAYTELARTDLVARVALLPEGSDPADLVTGGSDGRGEFSDILEGAEDALEMWFRLKRSRLDLTQDANIATVVDDCAHVLSGIEDPARNEVMQARMARQLGIQEDAFRRALAMRKRPARPAKDGEPAKRRTPRPIAPESPLEKSEVDLLACILASPTLIAAAAAEVQGESRVGELVAVAAAAAGDGPIDADRLVRLWMTHVAGDAAKSQLIAQAVDVAASIRHPEEALENLFRHRRAYQTRAAAQQLRYELQQATSAGDQERVDELTRRYVTQLREQQFG